MGRDGERERGMERKRGRKEEREGERDGGREGGGRRREGERGGGNSCLPLTSEFLETTFFTTAGKSSEQSFPLATI